MYKIIFMKYFVNDIIDGNSLTLDKYLEILLSKKYKKLYPNNCFPSNEMLDSFLANIKNIPDSVIKQIIFRFIVKEGAYGTNILHRKIIFENKGNYELLNEDYPIYTQRLIKLGKPWEGLTIELMELEKSNIRVAEFFTVLPSKAKLKAKLHKAVEIAQRRLSAKEEEK